MPVEELQRVTLNGSVPGPNLLITAGVHGDEYEGIEAIRELIRTIDSTKLRGRLTLIPVVNEPAYLRRSRTADDDKDLARTCPGSPDGTITERIAHRLAAEIREADYYIDLHTGGFRFKLLPLVGYMLHPDAKVLDAQRRMARAFGLPLIWGTSPHLDGRSLSVARDVGVPSLYAEHGGGGGCNPEGVRDYIRGCMNVMAELGMLDESVELQSTSPAIAPKVVEDPRPDSGHLQIHHPAPCGGYFRPAKRLGDFVSQGETLGWIVDLVGNELATISANQSGTILLLSDCPIIAPGDALAVILESALTA